MYDFYESDNENLTVEELHAVLGDLIAAGKGDYHVHTEAFCCGTNGVDLDDERKQICIG